MGKNSWGEQRIKEFKERYDRLHEEEFKSVVPEDMLNSLLTGYYKLNSQINQEQYNFLVDRCDELDKEYIYSNLDSNGYPLNMEDEVLAILEQFAVEELGWDYDHVVYNGLE